MKIVRVRPEVGFGNKIQQYKARYVPYLCTYDFYGPMRNASDAGKSITWPCEMASGRLNQRTIGSFMYMSFQGPVH